MDSPRRLTTKRIAQTKAVDGDRWLSDSDGYSGYGRLVLRIAPSGARRFYFRITVDGKTRAVPIGRYSKNPQAGMFTLKQARARARDLGLLVRPQESQDLPSRPQSPSQVGELVAPKFVSDSTGVESTVLSVVTVEKVCEAYVQHLTSQGKASAKSIAGLAKRHVNTSAIAQLPADRVTAEQVSDVLRLLYEAGHRRTVSHVRSLLHAAYNFALRAKLNPKASKATAALSITANPVTAVASLSDLSQPRERALDRTELGELMRFMDLSRAADALPLVAARLTIFLGGQRCEQLLRVRMDEVDLDEDIIQLLDGKGRREKPRKHFLPLVPSAKIEVMKLVQRSRDLQFDRLFSRGNGSPVKAGSVTEAVTKIRNSMLKLGLVKKSFSYADIRRTAETLMAGLGVSDEHRAQVQSHGLSGIQLRHYNKYDYVKEKREALLKWEEFVLAAKQEALDRHAIARSEAEQDGRSV